MLAVIMLVKKRGGQRRWIGIDSQGIECHLGDLLQNTGIFHGCSRRSPPGERAVSSHQDSWRCLVFLIFKGTNDRFSGVPFVIALYLLRSQQGSAGNRAKKGIRMGRPQWRYGFSALCPCRSDGRMGMNDPADILKCPVKLKMRRGVAGGPERALVR